MFGCSGVLDVVVLLHLANELSAVLIGPCGAVIALQQDAARLHGSTGGVGLGG